MSFKNRKVMLMSNSIKDSIKLSVIIPCLNSAETIGTQLEALANQSWTETWEVIVSDNGSTDTTLEIVKLYRERLPNLRVVDSSDLRGNSHARNVGVLASRGNALAFCDADDEVGTGWVAAIGNAISKYGFVASRFDTKKLNSNVYFRKHPQEDGVMKYTYPPYLPHVGGCGMGVKRSIHEAVGGFDESMLRLADTDYCWRIQLQGAKLHFVSNAVVHIRHRHTLKSTFQQSRLWGEYNVLLYKKYLPLGMPKLSWKEGVLSWKKMLKQLFRIGNEEDRVRAIWRFGWCIGRVIGSIKHRVFAL